MLIQINYGDVSGDGHEKTGSFIVESSKDVSAIRKAIQKGCEITGINLDRELSDYENNQIFESTLAPLLERDPDFLSGRDTEDGKVLVDSDLFEAMLLMLAEIGDPDLKIEYHTVEELNLYMGYGLF